MKKLTYLLVLFVLLSSFSVTGFARTLEKNGVSPTKSGSILNKKTISAPSVNTKDKESQNKMNVAQKRADTIRSYFNNMVKKIQAAINRESKLADRIESRLNKLASAGKDVTALKVKLADARTAIKDAQKYLDDAKAKMETVLKSDNIKQAFQNVKTLIKNAVSKVRLAHQKLVDIVNSMKGTSSSSCKVVSDCGKPLVCADGSTYPAWSCNNGECGQIKYFRDPCSVVPSAELFIKEILPSRGTVGSQVIISGTGFSTDKNTIMFSSGAIPDIKSRNGTTLIFTVPEYLNPLCFYQKPPCLMMSKKVNPGKYEVSVKNDNGVSNSVTFEVVSSITPPIGCKEASDCGKPLVCKDGKEYPAWSCNNGECGQIKYFRDPCTPLPSVSASPVVSSSSN